MRRALLPAAAALAVLGVVYAVPLRWLAGRWATDPFYSHGPLVPLVSLALAWRSRPQLRLDPRVRPGGLAILAGAGLLLLLGARLRFEALSCVSLGLSLAALAQVAGGRPMLRELRFPLVYLLFAVPLPMLLLEQLSLPLQGFSAAAAEVLLRSLGVDVARRGVLLAFPGFTLAVADACSGLRSLISVLAISALAAHLLRASRGRRLAFAGAGAASALAANVLRIALSGLVGLATDGGSAVAFFEGASGYLFFGIVILTLLGTGYALEDRNPPAAGEVRVPPASSASPWRGVLPLVFLLPFGALAAWARTGPSAEPGRFEGWSPAAPGWTVEEGTRRAGQAGEELYGARMRGPGGREARFSALHAVNGRYLHSPESCSLAAGWIAERQQSLEAGGRPMNAWILRRGGERVGLVFWYSVAGIPRGSGFSHHAAALWSRLVSGGLVATYGELSVPLAPGEELPVEVFAPAAAALAGELDARIFSAGPPGGLPPPPGSPR